MTITKERRRTASAVGNILNAYEKAIVGYSRIGQAPMRDRPAIKLKYNEARKRLSDYLSETIPGTARDSKALD